MLLCSSAAHWWTGRRAGGALLIISGAWRKPRFSGVVNLLYLDTYVFWADDRSVFVLRYLRLRAQLGLQFWPIIVNRDCLFRGGRFQL